MLINDKRALAFTTTVEEIKPIEGYDRVEYARVLGWWCIVAKEYNLKVGDKVVYFEIDSKVPDTNPAFAFLAKRHYKIKTIKMCKVLSQGLILPLEALGIEPDIALNVDLTERLGITYIEAEDNARKEDTDEARLRTAMSKHKKVFANKLVKKLMKYPAFRKLMFKLFCGKKESKKGFPSQFISKTDEERVQNMPYILQDKEPFIATEKIDGTSTTWLLVRKPLGRFEFYVCSRNVRMLKPDQETFMGNDNIYWENAITYDVEKQLKKYLKQNKDLKWVCIQGESYGEGWQGNPLKLTGHHFRAFNFIDSKNGRWNSVEAKNLLASFDKPIPWVPILDEAFILPDTVEELLDIATAKSSLNPDVLREGIVFRSLDGKTSFKAVSPEYLMKNDK